MPQQKPSLRTSLALRQGIWRKDHPHWHICGIPEVLYTDNRSDFTSKHLEQVAADLKIRLIFSTPGKPQGRGRVERFFRTLNEMFLCDLEGYTRRSSRKPGLTFGQLEGLFRTFLLDVYQKRVSSEDRLAPSKRWEHGGFLPRMPESLEQLDLLLMQEIRARKMRRDGIHFQSLRYLSLTLAAYVGVEAEHSLSCGSLVLRRCILAIGASLLLPASACGALVPECGRGTPFWTTMRSLHNADDRKTLSGKAALWNLGLREAVDSYW